MGVGTVPILTPVGTSSVHHNSVAGARHLGNPRFSHPFLHGELPFPDPFPSPAPAEIENREKSRQAGFFSVLVALVGRDWHQITAWLSEIINANTN